MTAVARDAGRWEALSADTSHALTARGLRSSNVFAVLSAHTSARETPDVEPETSTSPFDTWCHVAWKRVGPHKPAAWAALLCRSRQHENWLEERSLEEYPAHAPAANLFFGTFTFGERSPLLGRLEQESLRTCLFNADQFQHTLLTSLVTTGTSWLLGGISETAGSSRVGPLVFIDDHIDSLPAADPLDPARRGLEEMPPSQQRDKATTLLAAISTALEGVRRVGTMRAFATDDGAILLEWFAPHRRLGFAIEPNPADSGWFLVSDSTLGDLAMSGALSHPGIGQLVTMFSNLDNPARDT